MEFSEVIQKAVQIEGSSYQLYSALAKIVVDCSIKEFAQEPAQWEHPHKEKTSLYSRGQSLRQRAG